MSFRSHEHFGLVTAGSNQNTVLIPAMLFTIYFPNSRARIPDLRPDIPVTRRLLLPLIPQYLSANQDLEQIIGVYYSPIFDGAASGGKVRRKRWSEKRRKLKR